MSLAVDIHKKLGTFSLDVAFTTDCSASGLLGASGSGKSMTLMCVAGIVKPDCGTIVLNDRVLFDSKRGVNLTPQQRRVGYLFQSYALFFNMNVYQNILCGLCHEKSKEKKEHTAKNMIDMLKLNGLEKHRPNQLSGGQQQRVALARILVGNPELLILDEPFSALDSHLREQLQVDTQLLLKDFGKETLLVTHDRDEAYHLCQKIALLDGGRVVTYADTKRLFADPVSRGAALITGCKNIARAEKISDTEILVPDWGIHMATAEKVKDGLCAIGIRGHYFNPRATQNRFPVRFVGETEGPFEYIVRFRFENQSEVAPDIWWIIPKEKKSTQQPAELGVAPVNIMLLYE